MRQVATTLSLKCRMMLPRHILSRKRLPRCYSWGNSVYYTKNTHLCCCCGSLVICLHHLVLVFCVDISLCKELQFVDKEELFVF